MTTATVERDGTSVELELLADGSGNPLVSRDHGKPNLNIQETGSINPRHIDMWSGLEQYTISAKLTGSNAYSRAITLTDLLKSNSNGNKLSLNIDMPEFDSDINVVPGAGQEESVSIAYNPGWKNYVEVDLSLTRVNEILGGGDQPANTPTASGSGPIQLTYRGSSVDLTSGVTVERSVGRHQSVVRKAPNSRHPNYVDKYKTAHDGFELSFQISDDTINTVNELVDMFSRQLKRSSLNLNFNGLFGMGNFNVVPEGSGSLRTVRRSGYKETNQIPTIKLRRVL